MPAATKTLQTRNVAPRIASDARFVRSKLDQRDDSGKDVRAQHERALNRIKGGKRIDDRCKRDDGDDPGNGGGRHTKNWGTAVLFTE